MSSLVIPQQPHNDYISVTGIECLVSDSVAFQRRAKQEESVSSLGRVSGCHTCTTECWYIVLRHKSSKET